MSKSEDGAERRAIDPVDPSEITSKLFPMSAGKPFTMIFERCSEMKSAGVSVERISPVAPAEKATVELLRGLPVPPNERVPLPRVTSELVRNWAMIVPSLRLMAPREMPAPLFRLMRKVPPLIVREPVPRSRVLLPPLVPPGVPELMIRSWLTEVLPLIRGMAFNPSPFRVQLVS